MCHYLCSNTFATVSKKQKVYQRQAKNYFRCIGIPIVYTVLTIEYEAQKCEESYWCNNSTENSNITATENSTD